MCLILKRLLWPQWKHSWGSICNMRSAVNRASNSSHPCHLRWQPTGNLCWGSTTPGDSQEESDMKLFSIGCTFLAGNGYFKAYVLLLVNVLTQGESSQRTFFLTLCGFGNRPCTLLFHPHSSQLWFNNWSCLQASFSKQICIFQHWVQAQAQSVALDGYFTALPGVDPSFPLTVRWLHIR